MFWIDKEELFKRLTYAIDKLTTRKKEIKKIVLFGSLAADKALPSSDIDLVLIVENTNTRFLDRPLEYIDFFDNIGISSVDLFVYTEEETKKRYSNFKNSIKDRKGLV